MFSFQNIGGCSEGNTQIHLSANEECVCTKNPNEAVTGSEEEEPGEWDWKEPTGGQTLTSFARNLSGLPRGRSCCGLPRQKPHLHRLLLSFHGDGTPILQQKLRVGVLGRLQTPATQRLRVFGAVWHSGEERSVVTGRWTPTRLSCPSLQSSRCGWSDWPCSRKGSIEASSGRSPPSPLLQCGSRWSPGNNTKSAVAIPFVVSSRPKLDSHASERRQEGKKKNNHQLLWVSRYKL